ncbi:MAG: putative LPS assembly protein LptD [Saprospiraceae bacterium]
MPAIFGKILFFKELASRLAAYHHQAQPQLQLHPSNNNTSWFDEYARGTTADYSDLQRYSIFEGGPFGAPSYSTGAMSLNYSLNNIFEAKYFSKADSTAKRNSTCSTISSSPDL